MTNFIFPLLLALFSQLLHSSSSSTEEIIEENSPALFYEVGAYSKRNTMVGRYAHENEDRYVLSSLKYTFQEPQHNAAFFSVFDGHGGAGVSDFLKENIVSIFAGAAAQAKTIPKAIKATYEAADRQARAAKTKQGSTGVTVIICNDKIYLANAGDSAAIAVRRKENIYYYQDTNDHKPSNPKEEERIRLAGGHITQGKIKRVGGNLSVSRSIGDYPKETGLIATPEIHWLTLDETFKYIILFSDGVSDVMTREDIVNIILDAFYEERNAEDAARILVEKAAFKGSKDDITAVVVKLLWGNKKVENATVLTSPLYHPSKTTESLKRKRMDDQKEPLKRAKNTPIKNRIL